VGFFDFRCPISGLSLRAADAALLGLIEVTPARWLPLTLPIVGSYDRLGSIDGFVPDFRSELLVSGFVRFARAGRVAAPGSPDEYLQFTRGPTIERLLHLFERVNTMSQWGAVPFTLDGRPLRQVLIHAGIFAALAPPKRPARAPGYEELEEKLASAPVAAQARELFEEVIIGTDEVRSAASVALSQLTRVTRWLENHGKQWSPVVESGQYYASDDLEMAREAKVRLIRSNELVAVINRVIEALEEECAEG